MSRPKFIETVLDGWSGERLLALLVLGAVLSCHGAFGASHQGHYYDSGAYDAPPGVSHASHVDPQSAEMMGFAGFHGEEGVSGTAYFAALVAVSLGALLWLLNGARASGQCSATILPLLGRCSPPPVLHSARGPTPAVLQVFRR